MKQLNFEKIPKRKTFFGGTLLKKSHAKTSRPLSTKLPIHIVLKSSKAKGNDSFLSPRNSRIIKVLIKKTSQRFRIQVLEFSINSNHMHILAKGCRREDLKGFLRTLSALIARYVQNKHKPQKSTTKNSSSNKSSQTNESGFWDQRPFTRIVESLRGYVVAKDYVVLNQLEALGVVSYKPRRIRVSSA